MMQEMFEILLNISDNTFKWLNMMYFIDVLLFVTVIPHVWTSTFFNKMNTKTNEIYKYCDTGNQFLSMQTMAPLQCSFSSAISRVCTHSGVSCRKTNSPTLLCCRYQAKHSKLTEEIRLLSEATTYIFPHRNV